MLISRCWKVQQFRGVWTSESVKYDKGMHDSGELVLTNHFRDLLAEFI